MVSWTEFLFTKELGLPFCLLITEYLRLHHSDGFLCHCIFICFISLDVYTFVFNQFFSSFGLLFSSYDLALFHVIFTDS